MTRRRAGTWVRVLALGVVLALAPMSVAYARQYVATTHHEATTHHKTKPKTKPKSKPKTSKPSGAATTGAAACPTLAQANSALGVSYSNLLKTPTAAGGVVCEYTGGPGGEAGVTIFTHQSPTVFAGMVSNADDKVTGMQPVSGVGDGAFVLTVAGRSIVNAYSNASRTVVAAQASGALAPVEALARVALADN
jgi:hypothetical protein